MFGSNTKLEINGLNLRNYDGINNTREVVL